jgi:hypothetical protein
MTDLVPNDLLSPTSDSDSDYEARSLLAALAEELERKTNGAIRGEVQTSYPPGQRIRHQFSLRASSSGYAYDLFDIVHGIDEYPATLRGPGQANEPYISDREELEQAIARIFAAPGTRKLIKQLAQMNA